MRPVSAKKKFWRKRERFIIHKKKKKGLERERCVFHFFVANRRGGRSALIPTAPLRELSKTYEDGIHWEKCMHDAKQSGRRKKSVRSTYQRTGLVRW